MKHYQQCMAHPDMNYFVRTLAGHHLVQLNVPPESYRALVHGQEGQE